MLVRIPSVANVLIRLFFVQIFATARHVALTWQTLNQSLLLLLLQSLLLLLILLLPLLLLLLLPLLHLRFLHWRSRCPRLVPLVLLVLPHLKPPSHSSP